MANKRVPEFPALPNAALDDNLYIIDSSDTTDYATGTSKHIEFGNLISGLIREAENIGPEGAGIFNAKNGDKLQFRKLVAGDNMVLTVNGDIIEVRSTASGSGSTPVEHTFTNNADFNAEDAVFSTGLLYPVTNDQLAILFSNGQFNDHFYDSTAIGSLVDSIVNSGTAKLAKAIDPGTGADGSVTINSNKNLTTDVIDSGRTYTDGVGYSVTLLGSDFCNVSTTPNRIAPGDEVLLINLQGYAGQTSNVGNYEFLKVDEVEGTTIHFISNKGRDYGDNGGDNNIGTTSSKHKVMLLRVPNYENITVASGANLTCSAWDGTKHGVLAFRCSGTLTANGTIHANSKGYTSSHGGPAWWSGSGIRGPSQGGTNGDFGPYDNAGAARHSSLQCSGGGHYAAAANYGSATGGSAIGDVSLNQMFMGASGGIADPGTSYTSIGGGIIIIGAYDINVSATGSISSIGSRSSGGSDPVGGGAGGTIHIQTEFISVFNADLPLSGAAGYGAAGAGSVGRGLLQYVTLTGGTIWSEAHINVINDPGVYKTSGHFQSNNIVSGKTVSSIEQFTATLTALPGSSTATVQFSQDGSTRYSAEGTINQTTTLPAGTNTINLAALSRAGANFYYRIALSGNGIATPEIDSVTLNYSPAAYTIGAQKWISPNIGSSLPSRIPLSFTAAWTDDGDAPKPKFQIQGSDTGSFAGEQDYYPCNGLFYQYGTAYSLTSSIPLDLEAIIFTPRKYWRLVAEIDSGPGVTSAPTVDYLNQSVRITSNISTSPTDKLYAFHNYY